MSLSISIKDAEKELHNIMDAIEEKQEDKIILDSYETLNTIILKLIKEKDNKWITNIFKVIKKDLTDILEKQKELKLRDIRNYLEDMCLNIEKRQLINYIVELICVEYDNFYFLKK